MNNLLTRDNSDLLELEQRYSALNLFDHSNWASYANTIDIQNFRGERGYMSQLNYGMTPERYAATYAYCCKLGLRDLIAHLGEDGAFGAVTFNTDGVTYSRDLLDSVLELHFLEETLGWQSDMQILDVGAGYGRFAHRCVSAHPGTFVHCADAIPLSTFLCGYYLDYRNLSVNPTTVWGLDELAELEPNDWDGDVYLATNMYSFAEMTISAIEWWIKFCAEQKIRYFFLEPHDYGFTDGAFVSHEVDGRNLDYLPLFAKYGYKQVARRHKYQPREDSGRYTFGTEYVLWELA